MQENDINPLVVASVPFFGGILALVMVAYLLFKVGSAPKGEGVQVRISEQIKEGAIAFLMTEYLYLIPFVVCVGAFIVGVLEGQEEGPLDDVGNAQSKGGWQTLLCFLGGAALSAAAGWCGMAIATNANVKTMHAARTGLNPALKIAFAGGAVMGFTVVAFGILGLVVLLVAFSKGVSHSDDPEKWHDSMRDAVRFLSGFGFGASAIALFARVAGGIYTKAADVGADLVGKVESDIPEDDPRNPATIADNVGDNVGDVAGMGADLFESFVGSIIASATLAETNADIAYPFWIAGFGVVAAVIGFFFVRTKDNATQKELLWTLHSGVYVASILTVGFSALAAYILFYDNDKHEEQEAWEKFACVVIGLISGIAIGSSTEYFTSYAYAPTRSITEAGSMGGAATAVIQGLGIGMLSCVPPVIIITVAILACSELQGVYGVAIAAVGMLSTLGVTLATDAYGPIADNAGGLAEMTEGVDDVVRDRTDRLDALGNTTAATGKGFAIGSAVLTALALMNAFAENVKLDGREDTIARAREGARNTTISNLILPIDLTEPVVLKLPIDLTEPVVLGGTLIGAMLPFLFGALTMLSVRKAAGSIIVEVQRQFREIPGLLSGDHDVHCDSAACVALCTIASVKEMILPGLIAVLSPVVIGFLVGAKALGGLLVGSIGSGFVLALMMSNAGGAWDNAKKYVENEGAYGGKRSETHKACVVGDTIGDPFKDTSGPSLNILIKLMSIFSLTLAPVFEDDEWRRTWWYGLIVLGVLVVLCCAAYVWVWGGSAHPAPSNAVSQKEIEINGGSKKKDNMV
ncbi:hypothetical protein BSKO_01788 [Bryopsis sp. KO-2023]|nr:hypothetical protein BSKO_01788 [Bryopsis sp. KO-2023]